MHTLIIITAAVKDAANAAAKASFDPDGGERTFVAALVTPPDLNTITHYWCAAAFSAEKRALLDVMAATAPFSGAVQVWDYDTETDPNFPFNKRAELGLALHASEME